MRSKILLILASLALSPLSLAAPSPSLPTLDLSKKFETAHLNVATDATYANGLNVLIPAPSDPQDEFMVSVQGDLDVQCAASSVSSKKNADNTSTYFVMIRVMTLPANGGHCFIGIHMRTKTEMKQAFIDLFSSTTPPPQQQ